MTLFKVREYSKISVAEIEDAVSCQKGEPYQLSIYPDAFISGVLQIQRLPDPVSERCMKDFLCPTKHVGLVPVSAEVSLWVEPKVPIANIDQMAKRYGGIISKDIEELRKYAVSSNTSEEMRRKITETLLGLAEEIVDRGLAREYKINEDESGVLRGRLDVARTMMRYASRGIPYKAACSVFDRVNDTFPNRVIKTALHAISQNTVLLANHRRRAAMLLRAMTDVDTLSAHELFSLSTQELENAGFGEGGYERALPLAKMLVVDGGLDLSESDGSLFMEPLFVDMSCVFENYILSLLSESLVDFDVCTGNDKQKMAPLFVDRFEWLPADVKKIASNGVLSKHKQKACPDILVFQDTALKLIADVKYKPIGVANTAKREDLEQIVTYSERFERKVALSIHPCLSASESGLSYSGNIGDISVFLYQINLGAEDLGREEIKLVEAVQVLATCGDLS